LETNGTGDLVVESKRIAARRFGPQYFPGVLQMLALEGRIVIIDAMGTHTPIARQIVERSAYDVLALKNNQERLSAEASEQGRCHGAQRTLVAQRVGRLAAR
jgi:hypothetical protein